MNNSNIEIIRSKRKTVSVEIKPDLRVVVRAPRHMSERAVQHFICEKSAWIESHTEAMRKRLLEAQKEPRQLPLTADEIRQLTTDAKALLPERADYFARAVGVSYNKITIRHQRTRWGSCSSKGNLNFNCLLMLCPPQVLNYVIVHELCHRLEPNHSARFWAQVARVMPDYKAQEKWLKDNGRELTQRLSQAD